MPDQMFFQRIPATSCEPKPESRKTDLATLPDPIAALPLTDATNAAPPTAEPTRSLARRLGRGLYVTIRDLFPRPVRMWVRRIDPRPAWRAAAEQRQMPEDPLGLCHLRETVYSHISDDEFRTISDKGLFIVGNARSGTSILCACINLSPDVFVLDEAHLFANRNHANFVAGFNGRHVRWRNCRGKGTYVPPTTHHERGGLTTLQRMGTHYRYVGEKIAIGPWKAHELCTPQELFFAFHARYFYTSTYFLTFRNPAESIWSMSKMFPNAHPHELFRCWLDSMKIQLDVLHVFPSAYAIFLENLSFDVFGRIGEILHTEIPVQPHMIGDANKHSKLRDGELPPILAPYRAEIDRCTEIYEDIKAAFCPHSLTFKDNVTRYVAANHGFSGHVQDRINDVLQDVPVASDI